MCQLKAKFILKVADKKISDALHVSKVQDVWTLNFSIYIQIKDIDDIKMYNMREYCVIVPVLGFPYMHHFFTFPMHHKYILHILIYQNRNAVQVLQKWH